MFIMPTGVFKRCFKDVDPKVIYNACMFDMCANPNGNGILCKYFNKYASDCRNSGVEISNWRASFLECGKTLLFAHFICYVICFIGSS